MPEKQEKKKKIVPYKLGRQCPKCNSKMADHADRYACGKCGYTEFKQKK
jgi:ubiquitin-small subunit ribosomal protein S27Ae